MATAKLWWNGSSWVTSNTNWLTYSSESSSNYYWVRADFKIIAYDDATIQFSGTIWGAPQSNVVVTGTRYISVNGSDVGSFSMDGTHTQSRTFSVSSPTATVRWYGSSSMSCRGTQGYGQAWPAGNGSTTINNPFIGLTFKKNDGTSDTFTTQTVCKGASCKITSSVPTRTGYTFLGWSTSDSASSASYSSGGSYVFSSATTLYAVWQANSFGLTITRPATATVTILRNGEAFTGNTVYHDDVLTISAAPSAGYRITSLQVNGSDFVSGSTHTVSGAVAIVVDTIAQSSTIATYDSSVNTLDTFSLTVNRYSSSHYSKLRYYDSNDNLLYTSDAFTESTSLTVPQSWFTNFGTVTSIQITAILTTYTDPECTTITGVTDTCTFTVTADASMKPTLAAGVIALSPYNIGTGAANLTSPGFVKGYSKIQAVFDTSKITHAVGASAGTYAISIQGVSTSGSGTTLVSSNTITLAGSLTVSYTVTDSRGRLTTATQTISVNDYATPAIASLNCYRSDSYGNEDENDPYMAVTATCTLTPVADNAITITVQVKPTGGSYTSYGTLTNAVQSVIGGSFLADTSYYVKVTVTDTVGNSAYTEMSMPRRSWVFHMRNSLGGPGAAFGKVTEHDNTLQLANGWKLMLDDTSMTEADLIYLLGLDDLIGNTALPTTAQTLTGAIAEIAGGIGPSEIFPVGAIYMSVDSTSPASLFGGTWARITGRFLLAATDDGAQGGNSNASIAPGYTGGEASHKLTTTEMPSHSHGGSYYKDGSKYGWHTNHSGSTTTYEGMPSAGGNGNHNTMPPYLSVYVWKRTA